MDEEEWVVWLMARVREASDFRETAELTMVDVIIREMAVIREKLDAHQELLENLKREHPEME